MKKLLSFALALALLLAGAAFAEEAAAPALQKDLVVLFTSDVHCGIDQNWGVAGLYAVRQALEAAGNYTLLVDDGDFIQGEPVGTMTTGEALIDVMNTTGYDVAIPGNHEFDYGMDRFLELTKKANFTYISANFEKDGQLVFDPYVIKEFDGVKIAFVGATSPKAITSTTPRYFQDENGNWVYDFMQELKDEDGNLLYPDGRTPAYPLLYAQVTRRFRGFDLYVGGENLTGYRQKCPIVRADDPFSAGFDAASVWGPLMGAKIYMGLRITIWK